MMMIKSAFFTLSFLLLFVLSATAQSNNTSKVKGEGKVTNTGKVKTTLTELSSPQRKETIAKMEKNEEELNRMALSGDGRTSSKEETILYHARQLREKMN